jgi:hypothetical protein
VVFVTPPPVAVTVIGKVPLEVPAVELTVNTEEQLRLQVVSEKAPVVPEGRPAKEESRNTR